MTSQRTDPRCALRDLLRSADRVPAERQGAVQAALARAAESAGVSVAELREYALEPRQYDFNGLAGCGMQLLARSQETGKAVPAAQGKPRMKQLEYRLCKDRHGAPLVTLDSAMGNGQDIYPENLRALANALLQVADAADQTKLGKHEQWKSGVIELE